MVYCVYGTRRKLQGSQSRSDHTQCTYYLHLYKRVHISHLIVRLYLLFTFQTPFGPHYDLCSLLFKGTYQVCTLDVYDLTCFGILAIFDEFRMRVPKLYIIHNYIVNCLGVRNKTQNFVCPSGRFECCD